MEICHESPKPTLTKVAREEDICPRRWVINTSLLLGIQNWFYISASWIFMGKTCQLDSTSVFLVFLPHLEGNVENNQRNLTIATDLQLCVYWDNTSGNLDTLSPWLHFPRQKLCWLDWQLLKQHTNTALQTWCRFWIGTLIDCISNLRNEALEQKELES